jgi:hypothetical protein
MCDLCHSLQLIEGIQYLVEEAAEQQLGSHYARILFEYMTVHFPGLILLTHKYMTVHFPGLILLTHKYMTVHFPGLILLTHKYMVFNIW